MSAVETLKQTAIRHHREGRVDQAEQLYQQCLDQGSSDAGVLHALALITLGKHQMERSVDYAEQALERAPGVARFHHTLAYGQWMLGHCQAAEGRFRQALMLDPSLLEAYNQLGVLLSEQKRYDEAVRFFRQALQKAPDFSEAHNNLGIALRALGDLDAALSHYQKAIELDPQFHEAFCNMANVLTERRELIEARSYCERAIGLCPDYAQAHNQLGIILKALDQPQQAEACCRRAIALQPDLAESYNNLGILYKHQGRFDEAVPLYERAIELEPTYPEAYYNLGNVLKEQGRCHEAIVNYRKAITINPDYADAHWNLAHAYLLTGNFQQGWMEYQWRHRVKFDAPLAAHDYPKPRWDGTPFNSKTLLIYSEQGLGDTLQFVRYLPAVKALGGRVWLETWPPLIDLFRHQEGIDRLLETTTEPIPSTDFDLCASIMDLPALLNTTQTTIPHRIPYLRVDAKSLAYWQQQITWADLKVGVVWAGSPSHGNDHNRSCSLSLFEPLLAIPGIQWFSLQKGPAAAELHHLKAPQVIRPIAEHFSNWMDTACAVQCMDLIISVDTAVAHLAGALGRPTWVLLPFAPDWRWMLERQDSPWYPTMHLFRQSRPADWAGIFADIKDQLSNIINMQHVSPLRFRQKGKMNESRGF